MLNVKDLYVNYGAFQALQGISFSIHDGEIVTLLGGNGAGKTTSVNTICGLQKQKSGLIEFKGQDITEIPAHKRTALGIVQVPEGRKLFPAMTVMDNMLVGSYLKDAKAKRKQNTERCFELFPKLYDRRNQQAGSLSGGEQQMCAIARGMMQEPKLLMLDEPSLGLAPVIVDEVFQIIQDINKMHVTILLIEQNALASLEIADRAYVIETGHNIIDGEAKDLLESEEVKRAYLGI